MWIKMALSSGESKIVLLAIVFGIAVVQAWNVPRTSLAGTVRPEAVSGPVYRGEAGGFDQFYVSYGFENPGRTAVEIVKVEPTILLNGTDYGSVQTTHGLAVVPPGSEAEVVRVVQLANAPIGFVEGQRWNVTVVTEIVAESGFLLFEHRRAVTNVTGVDWEVHLFE